MYLFSHLKDLTNFEKLSNLGDVLFRKSPQHLYGCIFSEILPLHQLGSVDISDQSAGSGLSSEPQTVLCLISESVRESPKGSAQRCRLQQIQNAAEMSAEPNDSKGL